MPHSPIVPVDLDKRYRWAIVEYARNIACLPESLSREIELLLEGDTHPEAWDESRDTIDDLAGVLKRASRITDALAYFFGSGDHTGRTSLNFIKWLGASGWGNDKRFIILMHAWYEEAQKRKASASRSGLN